ncbi:MAG: hypothetical protein LBQ19_01300, partial [Synergistaceae bacterium]|nr:hypothetical protein [Synergistaceae bacterium]
MSENTMVAINNNQIQPYSSADSFALAQRMAMSLSKSTLVPPEFQGEAGVSNCLIAIEMAGRVGMSPFMCMQNLYVIHGRPSWSAKFLISMINTCGRFESLQYRMNPEKTACVAYAKDKRTGEVLEGPEVSIEMAKKEGWLSKNGSKWVTMPEIMLSYRAASFFARIYCPELSLGINTVEEEHDIGEGGYSEPRPVGQPTKTEKAKKITGDILGNDAPVIDAELKAEPEPAPTPTVPEPKTASATAPPAPTPITPPEPEAKEAKQEEVSDPEAPPLASQSECRKIWQAY